MATVKEQMILKAMVDYTKTHPSFRNRHIMYATDLSRQDINHYLNKWRNRGFVDKNPLVKGEWILLDLSGLIAELMDKVEPAKLEHAKHELFREDALNNLHDLTDVFAALRVLKVSPDVLRRDLEAYINKAIDALRNERTYMHRKQYSLNRARQIVENARAMVEAMGIDVDKLVESKERPVMSLVRDEE